jgi:hypothetical protein
MGMSRLVFFKRNWMVSLGGISSRLFDPRLHAFFTESALYEIKIIHSRTYLIIVKVHDKTKQFQISAYISHNCDFQKISIGRSLALTTTDKTL